MGGSGVWGHSYPQLLGACHTSTGPSQVYGYVVPVFLTKSWLRALDKSLTCVLLGYSAAVTVSVTMFENFTLTPALLLIFQNFFLKSTKT